MSHLQVPPSPGVSLGGRLDARPHRLPARQELDAAVAAGFATVRLPVRWSDHTAAYPPYAIEPAFLDLVASVVDGLLARGVHVVLNVHHFDELYDDPPGQAERFLAVWDQLAPFFADRPPELVLELLNEPRPPMTAARWNPLLAEALAVVRQHDRQRTVLVGPAEANTVEGLPDLVLPDDERLAVSVHYYSPLRFTHQGATWLPEAPGWRGTAWGSSGERAAVRHDLQTALGWAQARGRPLHLGEFGCYDAVDLTSRADWTACVRTTADVLGIPWAYWDLATDFGAWDPATGRWREPLRYALLDKGPASAPPPAVPTNGLSPPASGAPPAGTPPP